MSFSGKVVEVFNSKSVKALLELCPALESVAPGASLATSITKVASEIISGLYKDRVEKFCQALLDAREDVVGELRKDSVFSDIDFMDIFRACVNDGDSLKVDAYARLAISLKAMAVDKGVCRHFVLSLKRLAYEDIELLRKLYVINNNKIIRSGTNSVLAQSDILHDKKLDKIGFARLGELRVLGFIEGNKITELGEDFVKNIYSEDCLSAESIGLDVWQGKPIGLFVAANDEELRRDMVSEFNKLRIIVKILTLKEIETIVNGEMTVSSVVIIGNSSKMPYWEASNLSQLTEKVPYLFVNGGFGAAGHGLSYGFRFSACPGSFKSKAEYIARRLDYNLPESITAE